MEPYLVPIWGAGCRAGGSRRLHDVLPLGPQLHLGLEARVRASQKGPPMPAQGPADFPAAVRQLSLARVKQLGTPLGSCFETVGGPLEQNRYTWTSKSARYPKIESIGSIVSVLLGILEVQVDVDVDIDCF